LLDQDLAFGAPFGMIEREADVALVENELGQVQSLSAVQILNERGEYSATQGVLPVWVRPYTKVCRCGERFTYAFCRF
jgi:benzoate 4-monooxygenase